MSQYWENRFQLWAQPPSQSETEKCENAERAVRKAISASKKLQNKNTKVFAQGSYRNRTNVRRESDVDVGVVYLASFFDDYPQGTTRGNFGNVASTYTYSQFKNEVGEALADYFGFAAVIRGNKAFDVRANTYHVEADVAAFFEHRRYSMDGTHLSGVALIADNNTSSQIKNWPEQNYSNGVAKNDRTSRRFKGLVRILKNLRNEMDDKGIAQARPVMGFLSECLIWNVPDPAFDKPSYSESLKAALLHLYENTNTDDKCSEWGEVNELKYLFRPNQK